jgi:hypothetical protein
MIALLLEKAVGQAVCCDSYRPHARSMTLPFAIPRTVTYSTAALAFAVGRSPMTTNGEMPLKMGISGPGVVIGDY